MRKVANNVLQPLLRQVCAAVHTPVTSVLGQCQGSSLIVPGGHDVDSRSYAALPVPILQQQAPDEAEQVRRVLEMEQHASRPASQRSAVLPTAEETAARLRSHSGASCSDSQQSTPMHSPMLYWRDVAQLSQRQHSSVGSSMLTDSFGQVTPSAWSACTWPNMLTLLTRTQCCCPQAHAHLLAHLPHRALQPALHVLHARRRRGADAQQGPADDGGDHEAGAALPAAWHQHQAGMALQGGSTESPGAHSE